MKCITQILVLCFCLGSIRSQTLTCFEDVDFESGSQVVYSNRYQESRCLTDTQSCLRVESVIITEPSQLRSVITLGICADDTTCMTDCETLVPRIIEQTLGGGRVGGISLTQARYRISTCKRACCTTDNCNNDQSVQTILLSQQENITGESVLPFTCLTGVAFESGSQVLYSSRFEENQCPTIDRPQFCLRVESVIMTEPEELRAKITLGMCADESTCMTDCQTLVTMIIQQTQGGGQVPGVTLALVRYRVITCERACCTTDNCNNDQSVQTILQTPQETTTGESMLPFTCLTGVAFKSGSEVIYSSGYEENQCPTSNQPRFCLRVDSSIVNEPMQLSANITLGICADNRTCMTDCEALIPMIIQQTQGGGQVPGVTLAQARYRIIACEKACCTTNNCNGDQSVETTLQTQKATSGGKESSFKMKEFVAVYFVILSFFSAMLFNFF